MNTVRATPRAHVGLPTVKSFEQLCAELAEKAQTRPEGSGTVAQLGGNLPWSAGLITPAWDFASSGALIAQIGTAPIPGSDPAIQSITATDYLVLTQGCGSVPRPWPWPAPAIPAPSSPDAWRRSATAPQKMAVVTRGNQSGR